MKDRFEVIETPTETGLVFKDNKTNKELSQMELLSKIAKDISKIKKGLVD